MVSVPGGDVSTVGSSLLSAAPIGVAVLRTDAAVDTVAVTTAAQQVLLLTVDSAAPTTATATLTCGKASTSGGGGFADGACSLARFGTLGDVVAAPSNRLYIADTSNNVVRILDVDKGEWYRRAAVRCSALHLTMVAVDVSAAAAMVATLLTRGTAVVAPKSITLTPDSKRIIVGTTALPLLLIDVDTGTWCRARCAVSGRHRALKLHPL
jgi:hypothetical protein